MFATLPVLRLRVLLVAGLVPFTSLSVRQAASAQATAANEWTWMGGGSILNCIPVHGPPDFRPPACGLPGVYGTLGTFAAGNIPGSRYSAVSWTDSSGNFWLFGGSGYDAGDVLGTLNDLWEYKPSANEWAWMSGSSTFGSKDGRSNHVGIHSRQVACHNWRISLWISN